MAKNDDPGPYPKNPRGGTTQGDVHYGAGALGKDAGLKGNEKVLAATPGSK